MDKPLKEEDLDDLEKEALKQAGWKEGEPVPNLSQTQMAQGIQSRIEKFRTQQDDVGNQTPVPIDTPPVEMPTPVDIGELPPDQQQELRAAMLQAKAFDAQFKQDEQAERVSTIPGMAEAYQVASSPATVQITDTPAAANPTTTPTPGGFDPSVEAREVEAAAAAAPKKPTGETGSRLDMTPVHCPQCNHIVTDPVIEFDNIDKLVYVQHIEGAVRFEKEYSLFGGRVIVRYRNLTTVESNLIMDQLDRDVADNKVVSVGYMRRMEDYRLAAGIAQIRLTGQRQYTLPPVLEVKHKEVEFSSLPEIHHWLATEIMTTEHLRRAIGMSWQRFQKVIELLDSRSEDPDFWPPIEHVA
jgi:hypothetical protein